MRTLFLLLLVSNVVLFLYLGWLTPPVVLERQPAVPVDRGNLVLLEELAPLQSTPGRGIIGPAPEPGG